MNKEFCNYTQALALKELGFDEKCIAADYYADGKICIQYADEGITNTELDKLTAECNEDAVENGEKPINYDPAIPLYSQAFRWFREKYELYQAVYADKRADDLTLLYKVHVYKLDEELSEYAYRWFKTYEEAESACLDKLIEIVKHEKIRTT